MKTPADAKAGAAPVGADASRNAVDCGLRFRPGQLQMRGFPLAGLAGALGDLVRRLVVDVTELEAHYDGEMTFSPEPILGSDGLPRLPFRPPLAADMDAPSLFTALQEQFGLKLESARRPVTMLVIDHVEPAVDD